MYDDFTEFLKDTAWRVLYTFCEVLLGFTGSATLISDVVWKYFASTVAIACLGVVAKQFWIYAKMHINPAYSEGELEAMRHQITDEPEDSEVDDNDEEEEVIEYDEHEVL